jgi:hypothetical protein
MREGEGEVKVGCVCVCACARGCVCVCVCLSHDTVVSSYAWVEGGGERKGREEKRRGGRSWVVCQ